MNYWLCVTNEENWEVVRREMIWGVSEQNRGLIERVKRGDFLVFYVKGKKVGGVFEVVSDPFKDENKVFSTRGFAESETFPYRVRLKIVEVPNAPKDFQILIPRLHFISNKKMWPAYLRKAMQVISSEDYEQILGYLKRS